MTASTNRPPVAIVLDRLRSAFNTGNIFRLAEAVGAKEIITCGYTPTPPHPKLAKTAMGSDGMVACRHAPSSVEAICTLRNEGYAQILAVETTTPSRFPWDWTYRYPLAIILGNEALGIDPEALALCDGTLSLPMFGEKKSINVGNCAAVVLYSIAATWEIETGSRT
jgi:tRNA G18 (ribose-2'-O)-methylase SpoU